MSGRRPVVYWDSCVILAWIQDEDRPNPADMQGVYEVARAIERGEITMITSSFYKTEVLPSKNDISAAEKLSLLFKRSNVATVLPGESVMDLAQEIRDHYVNAKPPGVGQNDAVHLATAIHYEVREFHTFDQDGDSRSIGLLPLSGSVAGHALTIKKPSWIQTELDL